MAYRHTLSEAKAVVGPAVNLCATDTTGKLVSYINRACERLLYGPLDGSTAKWPSTYGKYRVCLTNTSCLTWPREIETIEAWALDSCPHEIRNEWYEFLALGPGLLGDSSCNGYQLIDDGEDVAFDVVPGGNAQKLAVYCDITEAAGASILLKYYRGDSLEKFRTNTGVEGETIVFGAAGNYVLTSKTVMPRGLYGVIKPTTLGVVRLYRYDTVLHTYLPLAYYEPNETLPVYRQSRIPGLSNLTKTSDSCSKHSVTVIGKFRFIPAVSDQDYVQIPLTDAIRLGAQAILREEGNDLDGAVKYWSLAFQCLQSQLAHFRGAGTVTPIRFVGASTFGGGIHAFR